MAYDATIEFNSPMDSGDFRKDANKLINIAEYLNVFNILKAGFAAIANAGDIAFARYHTLQKLPKVLEQMDVSADDAQAVTKQPSEGI